MSILEQLLGSLNFTKFKSSNFANIIVNFLIVVFTFIAIKKFRLKQLAGISNKYKLISPLLLLFPFYIIAIGLFENGKYFDGATPFNIILLLTSCLSIGFAEEFVFRGFMQSYFIKNTQKTLLFSIFIPAIIFGLLHLINLPQSKNIFETIGQSIYAIFFGVGFGALLLRTNKLYPIAIIHGLVDFVFSLNNLPNAVKDKTEEIAKSNVQELINGLMPAIIVLPLFIYGIYILRKVDRETIKLKKEEN